MTRGSGSRCTTVAGRCASTGRDWTRARTEDATVDAAAKAAAEAAEEAAVEAAAEAAAGMAVRMVEGLLIIKPPGSCMRHWRIEYIFMTTCYMYKVTIIIIIVNVYLFQ